MHLAASGGHYDLMQFLFSKGGSVEDEDKVRAHGQILLFTDNILLIALSSFTFIFITDLSRIVFIKFVTSRTERTTA